jgi:5'-nucleotidase / UDP-sugar diphosphatase
MKKGNTGHVLPDLKQAIIHVDKNLPKASELKEWTALIQYMSTFKSEEGIPQIPEKYMKPEGRYLAEPSWNPVKLIAGGNAITCGALVLGILLLCIVGLIIRYIVKKTAR